MNGPSKEWVVTRTRFVAFFDIMGFKDIVERNDHRTVVEKLTFLKSLLKNLSILEEFNSYKKIGISETKSITFSDSIVLFSKEDTPQDVHKIVIDAHWLIIKAAENGIAIKGALSYGEVTFDEKNFSEDPSLMLIYCTISFKCMRLS